MTGTLPNMTVVERCMAKVDHEAVKRAEQDRAAQATAERIKFLYSRLFGKVVHNRVAAALHTENAARELLQSADSNLMQVEILRVAVDNRWASVVEAFVKVWDGKHPIAATVQELWNLTTGRAPA